MGMAIETLTWTATNPGSTETAGTIVSGSSATLRNSEGAIIDCWQSRTAAGLSRVTSPLLHDSIGGMLWRGAAGHVAGPCRRVPQPVERLDTLTVALTGSGAAVEHTSLTIAYRDIDGIDARFLTPGEVDTRVVDLYGIPVMITPGTTGYGTAVGITSSVDQFRAGRDYAILGALVSGGPTIGAHAIRIKSPSWGNLGIGIPAAESSNITDNRAFYFLGTGRKVVPVISATERSYVTLDAIGATATALTATIVLGLLKG